MLRDSSPITQALLGTLFTWALTAAGAALVIVIRGKQRKLLDISLGFAGGVMVAASYWSLLAPAIEMATQSNSYGAEGKYAFVPVGVGFLIGAAFVYGTDALISSLGIQSPNVLLAMQSVGFYEQNTRRRQIASINEPTEQGEIGTVYEDPNNENKNNQWRRVLLLVVAITVHNIPEGLAVGVGFAAINSTASATFENARFTNRAASPSERDSSSYLRDRSSATSFRTSPLLLPAVPRFLLKSRGTRIGEKPLVIVSTTIEFCRRAHDPLSSPRKPSESMECDGSCLRDGSEGVFQVCGSRGHARRSSDRRLSRVRSAILVARDTVKPRIGVATNLAIGIGIQNFPEGLAVSLPLQAAGISTLKSFWYGQLSGMVEPLAGVLGAAGVSLAEPALPYALSFAAGAMIYVVIDDIVPEAHQSGNGKLASWAAIVGFLIMMSLDVGLG
ncbi:unnamed protein product [Xylocopa violacea]|uniref:Zinc transporter ZIP11 n=1 Tax=Xylocopa violacea TaxID=135666 RepID=A0ABP1NJV3_XYLVO